MKRTNYHSIAQWALMLILGISILFFWISIEDLREEGGYPIPLVAILWIITLIFLLTTGNILIYQVMHRYYSWESSFNHRFYLQLFFSLIYSLICINISYTVFKNHFTELPPDRDQMILLNIYGILFIIPLFSIQFGIMFLRKWKSATVAQEQLRQAQVQSELMALKSHISPHFLFNNLNILSSLIDINNFDAQDYLGKFSEVYRYVLNNRQEELVTLSREMGFLDAYIFLLKKRFTCSLQIDINIPPSIHSFMIPPLTLQILLENALKHNKLSDDNPLFISISVNREKEMSLVVSNNIQERSLKEKDKTGFGLENIRRRYWLLSEREIIILKDNNLFKVFLPLFPNSSGYGYSNH